MEVLAKIVNGLKLHPRYLTVLKAWYYTVNLIELEYEVGLNWLQYLREKLSGISDCNNEIKNNNKKTGQFSPIIHATLGCMNKVRKESRSKAYSELNQTAKMELFARIVNA